MYWPKFKNSNRVVQASSTECLSPIPKRTKPPSPNGRLSSTMSCLGVRGRIGVGCQQFAEVAHRLEPKSAYSQVNFWMIAVPRKMHSPSPPRAYYSCNMLSAMQTLPRRRVFFALTLFAAATLATGAQALPPTPSFEVAIVRLGDPNPPPFGPNDEPLSRFPTNHFYARNLPLKMVLGVAFGIDQRYVDGGPAWLDSQNYFIDAKVEGDQQLTKDQMQPLLQNLLAQRLGLKVHHESRLVAGYEMVVAKSGPKLQPTKGESGFSSVAPDRMSGSKENSAAIAELLSYAIRQPVIDKTGLTGSYDIKLSYAPLNDPNATSNNPDIFTAIQDQLGLKLVPAKVPVDYLVIDHVDRTPTEN